MATKIVCDWCGDEPQEFERYQLDYKMVKIAAGPAVTDAHGVLDLCGYCANQFRQFLDRAKDRVTIAK